MTQAPENAIRILFIHGLEGSPEGSKVQLLRAQGFDVHAIDMQMSIWAWRRRNSVLRQLFRLLETRLMALTLLLGAVIALATGSLWAALAIFAAVAIWVAVRIRAVAAAALRRSFEACVEMQRAAVERFKPDICVGSSWGGAVAAELVALDSWKGPTVLLAPAIARVSEWTDRMDVRGRLERIKERSASVPILVFHDPDDDTVPAEHSRMLADGSNIDLRFVKAGGHRLLELLERGELADAIKALVERTTRS